MFFNISNHPSAKWSAEQLAAAGALGGTVTDIAFPNVPPLASSEEVGKMADELSAKVPDDGAAMVMGEFSLVYALTRRLRSRGVKVYTACTDRKVVEKTKEDGSVEKTAVFLFVTFRAVE